jgi:tRNA pseudouridine13 synthase
MNIIEHDSLPYAFEPLSSKAVIRQCPEDFQVDEIPVVEAEGSGEHALLCVRKTGLNTEQVARKLAKFAEVKSMAVSYAGQKDKHAVTTQYFSVQLPGRPDPDWSQLESEQLQILSAERHNRKLKRGALKGNRFRIRLADFDGSMDDLAARVKNIKQIGVPNYFGTAFWLE